MVTGTTLALALLSGAFVLASAASASAAPPQTSASALEKIDKVEKADKVEKTDKAVDRIAVLPLEILGEVPAGRPALEAAVAKGLVVTGRPVMVGPDVGTMLGQAGARVTCVDPGCWIAAGRALGARHLIAGMIERKASIFEVEFRLVDAAQGRVVMSQVDRCDVADCSVAELSRLTVLELVRAGLPQNTGRSPASAMGIPAPLPVPAPLGPSKTNAALQGPDNASAMRGSSDGMRRPPSQPLADADLGGTTSKSMTSDDSASTGWPTWVPVASIVTGVAAGAVGGYLLYLDGLCKVDARCDHKYKTFWGGIATAGAGAILVAGGIVVAVVGGDDDAANAGTGLAIGPGSLMYSGRF